MQALRGLRGGNRKKQASTCGICGENAGKLIAACPCYNKLGKGKIHAECLNRLTVTMDEKEGVPCCDMCGEEYNVTMSKRFRLTLRGLFRADSLEQIFQLVMLLITFGMTAAAPLLVINHMPKKEKETMTKHPFVVGAIAMGMCLMFIVTIHTLLQRWKKSQEHLTFVPSPV